MELRPSGHSGGCVSMDPTVTEHSPLFELREWRRELDKLRVQHADDPQALESIAELRREADGWIRTKERR